jgi:hypothetical protein
MRQLTEEQVMLVLDNIIDEIEQIKMDASFGISNIKEGFIEELVDNMFKEMVITYGAEETARFFNEFQRRLNK